MTVLAMNRLQFWNLRNLRLLRNKLEAFEIRDSESVRQWQRPFATVSAASAPRTHRAGQLLKEQGKGEAGCGTLSPALLRLIAGFKVLDIGAVKQFLTDSGVLEQFAKGEVERALADSLDCPICMEEISVLDHRKPVAWLKYASSSCEPLEGTGKFPFHGRLHLPSRIS